MWDFERDLCIAVCAFAVLLVSFCVALYLFS